MISTKLESRLGPRLKPTPGGWYYHPFEIALCGFKDSGKTTLAEKLVARLSDAGRRVGFLKHDAHRFAFDKPGKDSFRVREAGAAAVYIQDSRHAGLILDHGPLGSDHGLIEQSVSALDILIVEGNKHSPIPKLLLLDPRGEMEEAVATDSFENVEAVVYPKGEAARGRGCANRLAAGGQNPGQNLGDEVAVLCRDDVDGILELLLRVFKARVPPVKGLVLVGGRSTRMGRTKAAIAYRDGESEAHRLHRLLEGFCDDVAVSARPDQVLPSDCGDLRRIDDQFLGLGPIGGILTAMNREPQSAWLVVSCDLPLLEHQDLADLIAVRDPMAVATAYGSPDPADTDRCSGRSQAPNPGSTNESPLLPEPLCALYEPKARGRLFASLARGAVCPRWVLRLGGTKLVAPAREDAVFNANEIDEYETAVNRLRAKQP